MFAKKTAESANHLDGSAGPMTEATDTLLNSLEHSLGHAIDDVAQTVRALQHRVEPLLSLAADRSEAAAQQGIQSFSDRTSYLLRRARRASGQTQDYIRHEPVKSVLFAAAGGAALIGIVGLVMGLRNRS